MHAANFQIRDETEQDAAALSQLSAQAFGPGRFGRTAYRIREGVAPVSSLALTAWLNDRLVGGIRFTAVSIGGEGAPSCSGRSSWIPCIMARAMARRSSRRA